MRASKSWILILLILGMLGFVLNTGPGPSALADDEPAAEGAEEPEAEPLTPEEARRLAKELTRAAKRRKAVEVLPVLDELGEHMHPSFEKPLLKMLTHQSSIVAMRAADQLALTKPESEKAGKKLGKSLWKKAFTDRANNKRYTVQGRALLAAATVEGGAPFANNRFKDLERLWRTVIGDPREANAPAIVAVCEYVRLTKDKRLCRKLAEEIDEPGATAVNSPTNPPASWWEKRWKMWKQYKAEVVETLEELTGESFKDAASAKAWFEANEKEFGFRW